MALTRVCGMTFMEMVIYITLACITLVLVGSLFIMGRRNSENTNANYFLTSDTETAVGWLRRDLQNAALSTIQTYPADKAGEPPGASWCSALDPEEVRRLDVNEAGNPNWQNHVYYTLQPNKDQTGKLVRWSTPLATGSPTTPTLASLSPSALQPKRSRSIHTRVVMPQAKFYGTGSEVQIDQHGGFRLQFVRRHLEEGEETLSDDNPRKVSLKKNSTGFESNTRLVHLELKFYASTSTGKTSYYELRFRVCPRY